ncbi:MAG: hypothetical protein BIFFINMI_03186 [Phycisphaerae bacterium]|nr:hypothetical protein [Phycisphaerae bacterium]
MSNSTHGIIPLSDRPNPGQYTPRQRLLRILHGQPVDRLPIVPTGLSPFTWHQEYPAYHPILDVAARHCEFLAGFPVPGAGLGLSDPGVLDARTEKEEKGDRKTRRTTVSTPRGELTEVRVHDRSVGSWATSKFMVENEDDLAKMESLPFKPFRPELDGLVEFNARVGQAGLPYFNGIHNALHAAVGSMDETFRILFCHAEKDRLRKMVERQQERLWGFVSHLMDRIDALKAQPAPPGAPPLTPVFRFYAIEPFVEPIQPPSFVDEFIVPYDREIVKLIHDRGGRVVMHCHGRLRAQIARMLEIGIDGTDCTESPPANDVALDEMVRQADGRMFIWGYIQYEDLAHQSGEQIEAQVRRAIEVGGTSGRYVLGQAASPWSAELVGDTQANFIRMIEAGVQYGGH